MEEYLTSSFKTALKAANRDKSTRTDKHVQDKLLHRDLDKLVKEESKTNSKMARIVKSASGESSGSSRTKPSFSTKRNSSPSRKSEERGWKFWRRFRQKEEVPQQEGPWEEGRQKRLR